MRDELGLVHLSTGDLLRDHMARATQLGARVTGFMDAGPLVHEQTEPLVEYYAALGLLRRVDGDGTPGEVFAAVLDALGAVPA